MKDLVILNIFHTFRLFKKNETKVIMYMEGKKTTANEVNPYMPLRHDAEYVDRVIEFGEGYFGGYANRTHYQLITHNGDFVGWLKEYEISPLLPMEVIFEVVDLEKCHDGWGETKSFRHIDDFLDYVEANKAAILKAYKENDFD